MNRIKHTLLSAVLVLFLSNLSKAVEIEDLRPLFDAIRQEESGGEPNGGRDAVGDKGKSLGPYQIGRLYFIDSKVPGKYEEVVKDRARAEQVMFNYWKRYDAKAVTRRDYEKLAKLHNGGPSLWSNHKAANYAARVMAHLKK